MRPGVLRVVRLGGDVWHQAIVRQAADDLLLVVVRHDQVDAVDVAHRPRVD
jgi:hypothetical protein